MQIKNNILVNIDYKLTDADGNHLNPQEQELIYLHGGYGHIFQEIEDALEGKKIDDTFKVTLAPSQAFGDYRGDLVIQEPLSELPEDICIGMELEPSHDESQAIYIVTNIQEDFALLNANHPLAGLTLTFEGKITELQELSEEEVKELLAHKHHHH